MLWQVDLSSEVPIYEQLASSVRREMAAGRLAKGDRLPSARDVAGSLAINLHTVLRAYQELREEGLIELRRGRGAVVLAANAKGEAHVRGMARSLVTEARRLGLERVTVVRGRAEEGPIRRQLGGADVVTARAVAPLDKLAGWCLPLLRPGGLLLAMKGSTAAAELAATGPLPGAADALVTQAGDPPATVIVVTRGTVRATARGGRAR